MTEVKYDWDGEKIKQTISAEEKKLTPKDILNALAHMKNQRNTFEGQKEQLQKQMKQIDNNMVRLGKDEKDLKMLEEKCIKLQTEKLKFYIDKFTTELKVKAQDQADNTISKDPSAHNDMQKKNLPYLNFQKLLATHPKVAENISSKIITQFLYETPIFKNPFE